MRLIEKHFPESLSLIPILERVGQGELYRDRTFNVWVIGRKHDAHTPTPDVFYYFVFI